MRIKNSLMSAFIIGVLLFLTSMNFSIAQDFKISGQAFADYYWFAKNHNNDFNGQHGFWFRRINLTLDNSINEEFSARVRFETEQPGKFGSGVSKEKMIPTVKDAYIKYKTKMHSLYVGLSSTPTLLNVEKLWNYRAVEKTIADLQKFNSSRDIGFALQGKIDQEGMLQYHVMFGNWASNSSELDKAKKYMLSLSLFPKEGFIFEVSGEYADNAGKNDNIFIQGFAGLNTKEVKAGIQFFNNTKKSETLPDVKNSGLSAFASMNINENISAFGRIDRMFDKSPSNEKIEYLPFAANYKSTLLIFGMDYSPVKNIKIMPNIEVILYDGESTGTAKPSNDIVPRLSFMYQI